MSNNQSLKVLTGVAIVATLSVFFISSSNRAPKSVEEDENKNNNFNKTVLSDVNSNIRVVSARLNKDESKRKEVLQEIHSLKEEMKNSALNSNKNNVLKLKDELLALKNEVKSLRLSKERPISSNKKKPYFIDEVGNKPQKKKTTNYIDLDEESGVFLPIKANSLDDISSSDVLVNKNKYAKKSGKEKNGIPFYTIPAGSDVQKATLLTSLIGEVPLNGKVAQPLFPFSSLISRGQLMAANGVPLPKDIIGMKIGGFSFGVGSFLDNISCVRAYATSALFLFKDGHFVTVGDNALQNSTSAVSSNSIGYLTDQFGSPCIKGSYHTNAPNVLSSLMLAGTAEGLGKGVAAWQQSTVSGASGLVSAPTGNFASFIGGHALGSTPTVAAEWLKNRIGDSFDFVYVPASVPYRSKNKKVIYKPNRLMLHFTQTIAIDKDITSRRVNYEQSQKNTFNDDF